MFACDSPQYSAHVPGYSPGVSGVMKRRLTRRGTTSRLPPSWGIQNEWMTSGAFRRKSTTRPAGRCSSLAVATPSAGYLNSHHHWWPATSIRSGSAVAAGASCVLNTARMVGMPMTSRMTAKATVHDISSRVWPWICFGMGAPGRSRKRQHA